MNMETYRWQLVVHERCRKPHPICHWFRQVYSPSVYYVECIASVCVPSLNPVWTCSDSNTLFFKYVSYWLCISVIQFWATSHFLHWIMNLSSQPVFSSSWNETAISVSRGLNPPRYFIVCFPWVWNELPWEMLPWGQCWGSQQYRAQEDRLKNLTWDPV